MKKLYSVILFVLFAFVSNAQVTIWAEDFSYSDGTTTGQGIPPITIWTADGEATNNGGNVLGYTEVKNNLLEGKRTVKSNGNSPWAKEYWSINSGDPIKIVGYNDVSVYIDLASMGTEAGDYMQVQYSLDGDTWIDFPGTPVTGDFGSSSVTVSGLNSNILLLQIRMHNDEDDDYYTADNIVVTGYSSPKTDFYAVPSTASINQTVYCYDASTDSPSSWLWSFSGPGNATFVNGTNSNSQNPEVQFDTYGQYTVSLVTNTGNETKINYIKIVNMYYMGIGSETLCSGLFYDSGGPDSDYSNNEDYVMTFYPATSGAMLEIIFTMFDVQSKTGNSVKDYFQIFDGENTSAPQMGGDYSGTNSPGLVTATNPAGAITFRFHSNNNNTRPGWAAEISCILPPPSNDDCANAAAINEVVNMPFTTNGATASGQFPGCGTNIDPVDIWYAYTATISGDATIDLCGSGFDTRLAVWNVCGGSLITCNDDSCNYQSIVGLPVTVGTTYFIQIGGYNDDTGDGDLTIYVAGEDQNTLEFDGNNDYVSIGNTIDINTQGHYPNRTIEAWFYAADINKTTKQVIWEEGGISRGFNIYIDNGTLYAGAWNDQTLWAGTWLSTPLISSQRWHHITLRLRNGNDYIEADKLKCYLDGIEFGSGSASQVYAHNGNINIAMNNSTRFHDGNDAGPDAYFEGKIDEVRIWNEARSVDDIHTNMHRELPFPGSEVNLGAYYKFNHSIGTTLQDDSRNGNYGVLNNMNNANWVTSTAPIPYYTVQDGNWSADLSWDIGQMHPVNDWVRVIINHNIIQGQDQGLYDLVINSSGSLTINPGYGLLMAGDIANYAGTSGLILEADATGMASLVHESQGIEAIVEQHFSPNAWHLVSAPVTSALSGLYTGIYLYSWSEADSAFTNIVSTTYPIVSTHGYYAWSSTSAADVQFEGTLNSGDLPVSWLTYTPQGYTGQDGWNLAGNPYPSGLKWDNTWSQTNLDPTVYVNDFAGSGNWIFYNYNSTTGNTLPGGEIPPTQGFYVVANAASPSMIIPNSARVHTDNDFYKDGEINKDVFTIKITGDANSYYDKITIGINSDATDNFDSQFDVYKLMGLEEAPQLYTYREENKLAVDQFSEFSGNKLIPLGIKTGAPAEYTFHIENLEYFNQDIEVYLEDKVNGTLINVRENPEYTFSTEDGTDESRFVLHLKAGSVGTDENIVQNEINIYSYDKIVYFHTPTDFRGYVTVINMMGQEVVRKNVTGTHTSVKVNDGTGYYVVKIQSDINLVTKKVFIK